MKAKPDPATLADAVYTRNILMHKQGAKKDSHTIKKGVIHLPEVSPRTASRKLYQLTLVTGEHYIPAQANRQTIARLGVGALTLRGITRSGWLQIEVDAVHTNSTRVNVPIYGPDKEYIRGFVDGRGVGNG